MEISHQFLNPIYALINVLTLALSFCVDLAKATFLQLVDFLTAKKKSIVDEVVVITGGAGGIGFAMGKDLAVLRAKVVLVDMNEQALKQCVKELKQSGWSAYYFVCDCSSPEQVLKVAKTIMDHTDLGGVDILINCTGSLIPKSLVRLTPEEIRQSFEANVFSNFWVIKAFLPSMMRQNKGHIVSICSIAGHFGQSFASAYSASKFAVRGLMESLHWEMADAKKSGIKTTTLYPYFIQTNMLNSCSPSSRFFPNMPINYSVPKMIEYILYECEEAFIPSFVFLGLLIKIFSPGLVKAVWRKIFNIVYFEDEARMADQLMPVDELNQLWSDVEEAKVEAEDQSTTEKLAYLMNGVKNGTSGRKGRGT